jgi:hypothetical protein
MIAGDKTANACGADKDKQDITYAANQGGEPMVLLANTLG